MQADNTNNKEFSTQIHQTIQSTVEKLYTRVDTMIQLAKDFVQNQPDKGEETVEKIKAYTKYMHIIIDKIVEEYSKFLQEEKYKVNDFKAILLDYVNKAKEATSKVQSLIG